jgi:mannose-1-phosphate guanylyltransferase/phosphomannomutase
VKVALPVAVPMAAEGICNEAGAEIIWTKLSAANLMEAAASGDVAFAGSQMGGYIFPRFLPAFDAVGTLVHILDLLSADPVRLSTLTGRLPRVHIAHEEVVTPWEQKGTVMRTLVERAKDRTVVLVDGIKLVEADGWTLILPDPEEPTTHVWAEGPSEAEARVRAQEQAVRIRQILR